MYTYEIWGTNVISDVQLDLTNKNIKRKLLEAKMMIDRSGVETNLFIISNGKIVAVPKDKLIYQKYLIEKGEEIKDFHEIKIR